jgi:hypothetical protein
MITSGVTLGLIKQDGSHINIAIDPVKIISGEPRPKNAGTYKLYSEIDSSKSFDKGYLGALTLSSDDEAYQYSGGDKLTDFELTQLAQFIRNYHATGKEFEDHERDISTK